MDTLQQVWQWVLAGALAGAIAAWGWVRTHKDDLADAADYVIGLVEKYRAGADEPALEDYAVAALFDLFPGLVKRKRLTEFAVRFAVRDACRRRREAAEQAGLREVKP